MKIKNIIGIVIGLIIGAVVLVIVVSALNKKIEPEIIVTVNQVEIKAPYGITQDISHIKSVSLRDDVPKADTKIKGLDSRYSLCGSFRMGGLGQGNVFLGLKNQGPCIYVKLDNGYILINSGDKNKTVEMYNQLKELVKK